MTTEILKEFTVEPEVESFLNDLVSQQNAVTYFPILTQFYSVKKIEQCIDKIIISNEELSRSNDKNSKGMLMLTAALVFVGLVQVIVPFIE